MSRGARTRSIDRVLRSLSPSPERGRQACRAEVSASVCEVLCVLWREPKREPRCGRRRGGRWRWSCVARSARPQGAFPAAPGAGISRVLLLRKSVPTYDTVANTNVRY